MDFAAVSDDGLESPLVAKPRKEFEMIQDEGWTRRRFLQGSAGVIAAAEDLNAPLLLTRGSPKADSRRSLIEVDTPQVIVETIKRAEDSEATVVRLYESWGGRAKARLRTRLQARRATLCDLLEREVDEVPVRDGVIDLELSPFKILTLKLES